jgi:hypothetical protein
MDPSETPAASGLSGHVQLYTQPEPIDAVRHAGLGAKRTARPFAFAAGQILFPIHVVEFQIAAVNYPIIFSKEGRSPLVVMGAKDGENLYISKDGAFDPSAYVPSFIRRYPFISAQSSDDPNRMVVCIDRGAAIWTEDDPDLKLFENGEPTAFTQSYVELCRQFDLDRAKTEAFSALLGEMDLFELKQTNYVGPNADGTPGEPQLVAEYFAVSETKLAQLSDEAFLTLRNNGALSQIQAHLTSLFGWDRLITKSRLMGKNGA